MFRTGVGRLRPEEALNFQVSQRITCHVENTMTTTAAEKLAAEAAKLPSFKNLALSGLRDKVAELLNMIGRVDGGWSSFLLS